MIKPNDFLLVAFAPLLTVVPVIALALAANALWGGP
jgi:hypothetical protein